MIQVSLTEGIMLFSFNSIIRRLFVEVLEKSEFGILHKILNSNSLDLK